MWVEIAILTTRAMEMYIAYDVKNGTEYAKLCTSRRDGTRAYKDYVNLGRVLDKDAGIFQNRERGIFTYDLESNTYGSAPAEIKPPTKNQKEGTADCGLRRRVLFGNVHPKQRVFCSHRRNRVWESGYIKSHAVLLYPMFNVEPLRAGLVGRQLRANTLPQGKPV